jgi:nicotinate phosphoribosyltransferase
MSAPQVTASAPALLTDLYQLAMLDAYYALGMEKPAVFEFFVRRLPAARNFLVAAGLEQVLDYLENLHFTADEIDWPAFSKG